MSDTIQISGNYWCPECANRHRYTFLAESRGFRSGFLRVLCPRCGYHAWLKAGKADPIDQARIPSSRLAFVGFDPLTDPDWIVLDYEQALAG